MTNYIFFFEMNKTKQKTDSMPFGPHIWFECDWISCSILWWYSYGIILQYVCIECKEILPLKCTLVLICKWNLFEMFYNALYSVFSEWICIQQWSEKSDNNNKSNGRGSRILRLNIMIWLNFCSATVHRGTFKNGFCN